MTAPTARAIAQKELLRCEAAGSYANLALDAALRRAEGLSHAERALATTLFYGVTEHRITLDAIIDARARVAPSAIEREVRCLLRLALFQLLYLDRVPDHAAVNEAVEAAPRHAKGFVNAILRSFCREGKPIPVPDDPIGALSVRYSVPVELAKAFSAAFGAARAGEILAAFSVPPPVTVRVNTQKLTREAFLARVEGARPAPLAPHGVILPVGCDLTALLSSGLCFVQDEASQLAVAALGVTEGARVLDVCAAPGSKSFGAALDLHNVGEVRSFDLHENKLSLIRAGAERLGITCLTADAADARRASPATLGTFTHVICDVPCSGYGVIAKKPDIRYKPLAEAAGLPPIQRDILSAAASCVAADGTLVYSTCTLLPAENEEQTAAFLAAHPDFSPAPFSVGSETHTALTLTPEHYGTDGFYIAKFKRNLT